MLANFVQLLVPQSVAWNWWHYEVPEPKRMIYTYSTSIEPLCQDLISRFGPEEPDLLEELDQIRYTVHDAANQKDCTVHFQDVLRITSQLGWSPMQGLAIARAKCDPELHIDLDLPNASTDLGAYIRTVGQIQPSWHQIYGRKKPFNRPFDRPFNRPFDQLEQPNYRP